MNWPPLAAAAMFALAALWLFPAAVFCAEVALALLPARRRGSDSAAPRSFRTAVLVPAHDEGPLVGGTVAHLLAELGDDDRLLVVADNCTDDTAATARDAAAGDGRVTVLERTHATLRGKGHALDFAVAHLAEGEPPDVVFVLDADCRVRPGTVAIAARAAFEGGRPAQSLNLCAADAAGDRDVAGLQAVSELGLRFKNLIRPRGMDRLGLPCHLMGTGMALPWPLLAERRGATGSVFGGELAEDMQLGVDLAAAGHPTRFVPAARVDSPLPGTRRAFDGQRTRWEQGHLRTTLTQTPRLLRAGLARGDVRCLALAADLSVPPFSLLLIAWLPVAGTLALAGWLTGFWVPLLAVLAGGLAVTAAVAVGWFVFCRSRVPAAALLSVPGFVLRKLPIYLNFLTRRGETRWVRTERNAPAGRG